MGDGGQIVYLDACCLNRPFDDRSQPRVEAEAQVMLAFFSGCERGYWTFAGSDAIEIELSRMPDPYKFKAVWGFYSLHGHFLEQNGEIVRRSKEFQRAGLRSFDSMHLALAEFYGLDALLTTDDAFLKTARRIGANILVDNPAAWIKENYHDAF